MTSQSSPVQSALDHVHQFKLALLFNGQDVDEGLVEHGSFRQLDDDLGGLGAAWCWDIDLLREPDVAVLQSKECVVGSHPHLRDGGGDVRWEVFTTSQINVLAGLDIKACLQQVDFLWASEREIELPHWTS